MKISYLKFLCLCLLTLFFNSLLFADGRPILPSLNFIENESSKELGFKLMGRGMATDEYEYVIYGESKFEENPWKSTLTIWLEARNGFGPMKRVPYAILRHIQSSVSSSRTFFFSFNSEHKMVVSNLQGEEIEYPQGVFAPLVSRTHLYLDEFSNGSNVLFNRTLSDGSLLESKPKINQIGNSSFVESTVGKYAIIFEDKGWVEFVPENQSQYPLRQIHIWVETRSYNKKPEWTHYATVFYPYHPDFAMELKNVPVSICIDNSGQLSILSTEQVVYQQEIIQLEN